MDSDVIIQSESACTDKLALKKNILIKRNENSIQSIESENLNSLLGYLLVLLKNGKLDEEQFSFLTSVFISDYIEFTINDKINNFININIERILDLKEQ